MTDNIIILFAIIGAGCTALALADAITGLIRRRRAVRNRLDEMRPHD